MSAKNVTLFRGSVNCRPSHDFLFFNESPFSKQLLWYATDIYGFKVAELSVIVTLSTMCCKSELLEKISQLKCNI